MRSTDRGSDQRLRLHQTGSILILTAIVLFGSLAATAQKHPRPNPLPIPKNALLRRPPLPEREPWIQPPDMVTAAPTALSLGGCSMSDYFTNVTVGGQAFQMLVDTGSTTMAVATTSCATCSGVSPQFANTANTVNLNHPISGSYGDGSGWSGRTLSDFTAVVSPSFNFAFAGIDAQSDFFFAAQTCTLGAPTTVSNQGIIGMAYPDLAIGSTQSYIDDLFTEAPSIPNVFALQMCRMGGRMWIGGYDPAFVVGAAAPQYTPVTAEDYYEVDLSGVSVGANNEGAATGLTIVDSGTSLLVLQTSLFTAVNNALKANSNYVADVGANFMTGGGCFSSSMTKAQLDAALPPLGLTFPKVGGGSFTLTLPATESYLNQQDDTTGKAYYCPGVANGGGQNIIGNGATRSQITIYDRGAAAVGFAPAQFCDGVPTGSGAAVTTSLDFMSATFPVVTTPGTTTATQLSSNGLGLPAGYAAVGPAYDVSTTAVYTGSPTLCFTAPGVTDSTVFQNLRLLHKESGTWTDRTTSVDFATQTVCGTVPSFSPVAIVQDLAPTAAPVAISGRVLTPDGRGLTDARVTFTDPTGKTSVALTGSFGYYRFDGLMAGGSYVVGVASKQFSFSTRIVTLTDDLTGFDFVAEGPAAGKMGR